MHGASPGGKQRGDLNYDEIVVYEEAAVLPWAVVEYKFFKHGDASGMAVAGGSSGAAHQRRLNAVCVAGMGNLGPGIAAEFALHGVEVRVWNDPRFSNGQSASEFSKIAVVKALLAAEQAAGLNVPSDTAREGRASGGGGGGSSIESITAQLMNDRYIAAADLVTGCDTIAELVEGVHPYTVSAGTAQPLQIVIEALYSAPQVKFSFFTEICKSPSLPKDVFLTSNALEADFNLSAIADKLDDFRRPYVLGMRFLNAGPAGTAIGVRVVEGYYINDSTQPAAFPADVGAAKLKELSKLIVEADKILLMPTKNSSSQAQGPPSRGWDRLCSGQGTAPVSVNSVWLRQKAGIGRTTAPPSWDLRVCMLCGGKPSEAQAEQVGGGSHMFVCTSCEGRHQVTPTATQFDGATCREMIDIARSLGYLK